MSKLKELQKWIKSYQTINNSDPPIKSINAKIKELIKEDLSAIVSVKVSKIYFRDSIYSDYDTLRKELALDAKFVEEYRGVDLRAYIEDALAWSEKGNTTTDNGWKLTLKNWIRKAKRDGRMIMKPDVKNKVVTGHINY